ncbi:PREDICTED: cell wall protein RBR3-like [Nelumbo nucifera]|uniref:Cell wall protein RBR3-like n=2 Tax=Nelumbo nucifera TaxID=4432 RepID=A0A1U8AP88_NELNU|nr:PREDICTED: cell wall protein RBR3-like [Nelumbo nucifera]XP_010269602.1 PREDICTED: cell wall protein RBR3-like [Nelumbo nucifera]DAD33243.1 TPA_asm: hypothetical protein HUJ06_012094 [Nelumbo nucifera]
MNSNFGRPSNPQGGSVSLNNYQFDFGPSSEPSSNRPRSLNDQKQQYTSSYSFPSSSSSATTTAWSSSTQPRQPSSWAPNKPSWTHQPSSTLSNSTTSMVGDIFGKSWASTAPSSGPTSCLGLGLQEKNPNLFGDLVGSAFGQAKSNTNVSLKNAAAPTTAQTKKSFSMGSMADSLPKANAPMRNTNLGSADNFGSYSTASNQYNKNNIINGMNYNNQTAIRSGDGAPASSNNDPFASLVDFGSKPTENINSTATASSHTDSCASDCSFGDFQRASKSNSHSFPPTAFPATSNNSMGSSSGSTSNFDNYGIPRQGFASQKKQPPQATSDDPFNVLFPSSSNSTSAAPTALEGVENQPFSDVDDWGLGSEFGGGDAGSTTELEGLPPPPAGVTALAAKQKGLDNYKQGQFPDAIKWLSWAVALLEKTGDSAATMEVLSCRASCYKEVGEYKKAVVDCSKVLEHDRENVSVLIQRALLYESTEKYKLGAEDLRTVLKIDPANRIARSTIHRLTKLAD